MRISPENLAFGKIQVRFEILSLACAFWNFGVRYVLTDLFGSCLCAHMWNLQMFFQHTSKKIHGAQPRLCSQQDCFHGFEAQTPLRLPIRGPTYGLASEVACLLNMVALAFRRMGREMPFMIVGRCPRSNNIYAQ